jgi:hypothetical protein
MSRVSRVINRYATRKEARRTTFIPKEALVAVQRITYHNTQYLVE